MRASFNGLIAKYTAPPPSVVSFDAVTTGNSNVSSYSHSCSGSNRCLVVLIGTATQAPSSVTYGGVNLTNQGSVIGLSNVSSIWYLVNPSSGSNTVEINSSGFISNSVAVSFTNVKQTSTIRNSSTTNGSTLVAGQPTITVSGFVTNDYTVGVAFSEGGGSVTSDGQTTTGTVVNGCVGNRSSSGGTLTWSGATGTWSIAALILAPV